MPDSITSDVLHVVEHLYLEITSKCNLSCPHCSVRSWENNTQEIDYSAVIALLADFRAQGGRYLTISGGEPGLWSDLPDLILNAADLGLEVTIFTNGLAVTKRVIDSLKEASGLLAVSLDGPDANIHEEMRGEGTFAPAVDSFEKAIGYLGGSRVMLSCVLSKPLLPHTNRLWQFTRFYGIKRLYLGIFEPLKMYVKHPLAPETTELIEPVLRLLNAADDDTQLLFSESHDLIYPKTIFSVRNQENILGRTVKVQANGWAYPGPFFYDSRFRLGRPMEQGWLPVLNSHVYTILREQAINRIHNVNECSKCFWAYRCGGGSLALTWAVYGKWDESCPLCELYKATLDRAARRQITDETYSLA